MSDTQNTARTYWTRRSFNGRGAGTAHLIVAPGRKTACGTHLGYGNLSPVTEGDTTGRCARCAKADK